MRSTSSLRNWLETTNPDLFHFPAGNFLTSSVFIVYPVSVNSVRRNMSISSKIYNRAAKT